MARNFERYYVVQLLRLMSVTTSLLNRSFLLLVHYEKDFLIIPVNLLLVTKKITVYVSLSLANLTLLTLIAGG